MLNKCVIRKVDIVRILALLRPCVTTTKRTCSHFTESESELPLAAISHFREKWADPQYFSQ
jgi:hypothetical protein